MYSQVSLFKKLLSCVPLEEYIINLLSYILSFTQLSLRGLFPTVGSNSMEKGKSF